jgi:hypothetical protein
VCAARAAVLEAAALAGGGRQRAGAAGAQAGAASANPARHRVGYDPAMRRLKDLWLGELPLDVAFWTYAIVCGLVLNVLATAAALVLIVLDAPVAIAIVVYLSPLPYSVLAICGVWRSADRYPGRRDIASAAKAAVIVWFCFWLVA